MSKLSDVAFEDKRKKPVTIKGTKVKKDISFNPTDNPIFKKGGKVGLYANINRRKKLGISRPKSKTTISKEAYSNMKKGFPSRGQGIAIKIKQTKQY